MYWAERHFGWRKMQVLSYRARGLKFGTSIEGASAQGVTKADFWFSFSIKFSMRLETFLVYGPPRPKLYSWEADIFTQYTQSVPDKIVGGREN